MFSKTGIHKQKTGLKKKTPRFLNLPSFGDPILFFGKLGLSYTYWGFTTPPLSVGALQGYEQPALKTPKNVFRHTRFKKKTEIQYFLKNSPGASFGALGSG